MLKRIVIDDFRCLVNFDLEAKCQPWSLESGFLTKPQLANLREPN